MVQRKDIRRDRRGVRTAVTGLLAMALLGQSPPGGPGDAAAELLAHMKALKSPDTIETRFVCEKRLAALDSPLLSGGTIWIAKPGSIRFSTTNPYRSELIIRGDKLLAKSQHETRWTTTALSARPGLPAVMGQLGNWAAGDAGNMNEMYEIARGHETIPATPALPGDAGAATTTAATAPASADVFVLKPRTPEMQKAIKTVELGVDQARHRMVYIQITTVQDDVTRYWFFDTQMNRPIATDTFAPADAKP